MRTKALILGALPVPTVGEWVPISEGEKWRCWVESIPGQIQKGLRVDVELSNGSVTPCPIGSLFGGRRVRLVIEDKQEVDVISAFVEEVIQ